MCERIDRQGHIAENKKGTQKFHPPPTPTLPVASVQNQPTTQPYTIKGNITHFPPLQFFSASVL